MQETREESMQKQGLDYYGANHTVGGERLQNRASVVEAQTASWAIKIRQLPDVLVEDPPMGETLTERTQRSFNGTARPKEAGAHFTAQQSQLLAGISTITHSEAEQPNFHISALEQRTANLLHLRVVMRVLSPAHLESLDTAGRAQCRSALMLQEPIIQRRYDLSEPKPAELAPEVAPSAGEAPGAQGSHTEAVMQRLLLEVLGDTEIRRTFDSLPKPDVPYFDTAHVPPEAKTAVAADTSDPTGLDSAVRAAPAGEFKSVASEVLHETLFNLMREALHGAFDVRTVPRKVVTQGISIQ